jgi:hypothetical protein
MTRSGLLLRLSKKGTRDGLQILDFTSFTDLFRSDSLPPFHLSTAMENHPTVAVAVEATPVWKSSPQDRYINLESFSPSFT